MRFKTDWASLIVGRKVTVFALFYFVYENSFQVQAPSSRGGGVGGLYLEGRFNRGSFALRVWGWGGGAFYRNFTVLTATDSEAE